MERTTCSNKVYNLNCEKKPATHGTAGCCNCNQPKQCTGSGAVRTYIGMEDIRRRGDRPPYSGSVNLVSATEGNRVKGDKGNVHSMTLTKPVPQNSKSTDIKVRLYGCTQTEDRKREQFKQFAQNLKTLLMENGAMFTSVATTELYEREPDFKKELGKMKLGAFLALFLPDMFKLQTSSSGGTSKVMLNR